MSEENKATIMDDPFIRFYIGDLLRTLRTQYLIDLIKPYTRLELEFLARVCSTCMIRYQPLLTDQHSPATKCRQGRGRRAAHGAYP
jgi:COP9 signalosome complex subunit 2